MGEAIASRVLELFETLEDKKIKNAKLKESADAA